MHVKWGWKDLASSTNWSEFQRRCKHLIAIRLELETILEWVEDFKGENIIGLIQPTVPFKVNSNQEILTSFWFWDEEIKNRQFEASVFKLRQEVGNELDKFMDYAIRNYVDSNSDLALIDIKKQISSTIRAIHELVSYPKTWKGLINGGPLLPEQQFLITQKENGTDAVCVYDFTVAAAQEKYLGKIQDIQIPALSMSSKMSIHYGSRTLKM